MIGIEKAATPHAGALAAFGIRKRAGFSFVVDLILMLFAFQCELNHIAFMSSLILSAIRAMYSLLVGLGLPDLME